MAREKLRRTRNQGLIKNGIVKIGKRVFALKNRKLRSRSISTQTRVSWLVLILHQLSQAIFFYRWKL
jgi:hypothetical protein